MPKRMTNAELAAFREHRRQTAIAQRKAIHDVPKPPPNYTSMITRADTAPILPPDTHDG